MYQCSPIFYFVFVYMYPFREAMRTHPWSHPSPSTYQWWISTTIISNVQVIHACVSIGFVFNTPVPTTAAVSAACSAPSNGFARCWSRRTFRVVHRYFFQSCVILELTVPCWRLWILSKVVVVTRATWWGGVELQTTATYGTMGAAFFWAHFSFREPSVTRTSGS